MSPSGSSPSSRKMPQEMIQEIKDSIITGIQRKGSCQYPALVGMILKISKFINENPQIREMELNPIFAYKNKALAVDARIILEGS
jgi:acyl-CoA synthetase (NDP forming)